MKRQIVVVGSLYRNINTISESWNHSVIIHKKRMWTFIRRLLQLVQKMAVERLEI